MDIHEGLRAPAAQGVDRPREHALSGAGFAEDHHPPLSRCDLLRHLEDRADRWALTHEVRRTRGPKHPAPGRVLLPQAQMIDRALQRILDQRWLGWLAEVVERPG